MDANVLSLMEILGRRVWVYLGKLDLLFRITYLLDLRVGGRSLFINIIRYRQLVFYTLGKKKSGRVIVWLAGQLRLQVYKEVGADAKTIAWSIDSMPGLTRGRTNKWL